MKKSKRKVPARAKAKAKPKIRVKVKVTARKHRRGERRCGDPHPRPEGWLPASKRYTGHQPARMPNEIKVGKRYRKDLGDLKAFAADINVRGLLHPIVIDPDCNLIAGARRLRAWKLSKFKDEAIPVHVVPLVDILAGEWAENDPALRRDFKLTEAVAIRKAIEAKLKPEARARLAQGAAAGGRGGGKIGGDKINVAERASQFTGKSRRTLDKAEAVDDAAKRDPARFGKLKEDMDRTGRADAPYKRLQNMLAADALRKAPAPLPGNGPYAAGIIDIPWAGEPDDDDPDRRARGYYPYPTMTTAQAVAFMKDKVEPILAPACTIGFWITNYHLEFAHHLPILAALNMKPRAILTGTKDLIGRGQVARGTTEHMVLASRGEVVIQTFPRTDFPFKVDKKNHSRKPQDWFDRFVEHVPAPRYFSLFETVKRGTKWDCHGDKMPEAPAAATIAAKVFGGDVGPKAIAILSAKAAAGVIPFKDHRATLCWREKGGFDFDRNSRFRLRGGIELLLDETGVGVTAYNDDRGIGYVGSTMPYKKVQRLLMAWGKVQSKFVAAIVLPAGVKPRRGAKMEPVQTDLEDYLEKQKPAAGHAVLLDASGTKAAPALIDQLTALDAASRGALAPGDAGDLAAYLEKQKLIMGKKTPRITKTGRARLSQLRKELAPSSAAPSADAEEGKEIARALAEDFPNGVEGHTIKQTIDWSGGVPGMSVATCQCGESWRASRDLPLSGHEELDRHIVAHWRKVVAEGAQARPPHAQAAE